MLEYLENEKAKLKIKKSRKIRKSMNIHNERKNGVYNGEIGGGGEKGGKGDGPLKFFKNDKSWGVLIPLTSTKERIKKF